VKYRPDPEAPHQADLAAGRGWPVKRLVTLAEGSPGVEVCGLLVRGEAGEVEPWPVPNVSPTPARAFELSPLALLDALRRLDREGGLLVGVYHSHLGGGAGLSARDLEGALVDGTPVLRGAAQVVVALECGRATVVRAHRWSGRCYEPGDVWRRPRIPPSG
jgi:proteasome lid subunit RPN8/RPN11